MFHEIKRPGLITPISNFNTEKYVVINVWASWKSTGTLYLVSDLAIFDRKQHATM